MTVALAVVVFAAPAGAGKVGAVLEAPTPAALSLTISQAIFRPASTGDVVVVDERRPALIAVAAAFAGMTDRRAPVLLAGPGVPDNALRGEIARVTDRRRDSDPPRVWLFGTSLADLEGYDVRTFAGSDADIAASILETGALGGTATRVLLFPEGDWGAGAIAAAFGAAWGVPVVPVGSGGLSPRVAAVLDPERALVGIAIGAVNLRAEQFARLDKIEGATPAALSAAAAKALFEPEHPAGAPIEYPLEAVAADGYGPNPAPALLAAVVTAFVQDDHGAKAILFLVDGKPAADLAAACAAKGRDEPAVCAMAQIPGDTTVLALTANARQAGPPGGRLPATGSTLPAAHLALALAAALLLRRIRTGVAT